MMACLKLTSPNLHPSGPRFTLSEEIGDPSAVYSSNGFVMWTSTTEKSLIEEQRSSRSRRSTLRHPRFCIRDPNGLLIVFEQDL